MNVRSLFALVLGIILVVPSEASNIRDFLGSGGGGPTWVGYTSSTYNGLLSGAEGANQKCDTDYSGSHACTWDEIQKLGTTYPYSSTAWVVDGAQITWDSDNNGQDAVTKDGYDIISTDASWRRYALCKGWSIGSSGGNPYYHGTYIDTAGRLRFETCNNVNYLPCCK